MYGLDVIDLVVILVYFVTLVAIGFWCMKRIKNQEDFFLAGRSFGKLIQTFAAFGQGTSADTAVGTTTTTFTNGAAGIWSSLAALFATPVYWIIAPWFRRIRLISTGDYFEERYQSKSMAMVYAILISCNMMIVTAVGISAMSKTVLGLTPKPEAALSNMEREELATANELHGLESTDYALLSVDERERLEALRLLKPRSTFSYINEHVLVAAVCVVVLVYGIAGGLFAAFITDTIQGMFIILLSVIMLPFAWMKVNEQYGGSGMMDAFRTLHERLPESCFEVFGSPTTVDFTWYYIAIIALIATLNNPVQPNMLVAIGSAKDEYTGRFGFTVGNYMKRVATILWGIFALFIILLYSDVVHDPDKAWGMATRDLLGGLGFGLVGLMAACLMAALMSTADCLMITVSGLLTHSVVRPIWPNLGEKWYVLSGRVIGAVTVIGGGLIAIAFPSLFDLIKLLWEFSLMFIAAFWLGMIWRRATRPAAWASIVGTLVFFVALPYGLPVIKPSLQTKPYLLKMTQSREEVRTYTARAMDVSDRQRELATWAELSGEQKAERRRPEPLEVGQEFSKTYRIPGRAIFWMQGVKVDPETGTLRGSGALNISLLALEAVGIDLAKMPHALNQTLRLLIRVGFVFGVLIILSLLTRHTSRDKAALDKFYVRMKTPVVPNREEDARQVQLSYENPSRFDHRRLLPGTGWEFQKWTRVDAVGFAVSVVVLLGIIGMFFLLVNIGAY